MKYLRWFGYSVAAIIVLSGSFFVGVMGVLLYITWAN